MLEMVVANPEQASLLQNTFATIVNSCAATLVDTDDSLKDKLYDACLTRVKSRTAWSVLDEECGSTLMSDMVVEPDVMVSFLS